MRKVSILKNKMVIDKDLEEYHNLIRTNIQLCGTDIKTIILTSAIKSEGKSTVSINIAFSLAKIGLNVLYIDADIRKSKIITRFKFEGKVEGLTNYLSGMSELENIIYTSELENLKIIPAGSISPNPTELLQNKRFKDLIESSREQYDYIIIDTSPMGVVIDPIIILNNCDASILVTESKTIRRKELKKLVEQLQKTKKRFLGVILNKLDMKKSGYGNYGNYGEYGNY